MTLPFKSLRFKPIPPLAQVREQRAGARALPIARDGAQFREPLVSAEEIGVAGRNHYAHAANPPYYAAAPGAIDRLLLRESAAARLRSANESLRAEGLALFVFDAWRPRAVQAFFHDVWTPRELQRRRADLRGEALRAEVEKYWAAPTAGPDRPAPHATGGAVDLTLTWAGGAPLFMGSVFDDATPLAHTDRFEAEDGAGFSFSAAEARANRRILYWIMHAAGFANHPDEWWHFSFGDQMWAAFTGAAAALYGAIEDPDAGPPEGPR